MQAASLAAAKKYEKDAIGRIRRIGIISADLEVKGKQRSQGHFPALQGSRWADGSGDGSLPPALTENQASAFISSQY